MTVHSAMNPRCGSAAFLFCASEGSVSGALSANSVLVRSTDTYCSGNRLRDPMAGGMGVAGVLAVRFGQADVAAGTLIGA